MSTKENIKKLTIKKIDSYPLQVELHKYTELVKYVIEQRDLLEGVECKSLADFEAKLNKATGFVNANLSSQAMGQEVEHNRLTYIENLLTEVDLKDEDIDTEGNFKKAFTDALKEKHTIYFTKDEMIINKKIDSIIKSYNALDVSDRKKLIVNRSNQMQINPFIRY
jgi:hypothetical protein